MQMGFLATDPAFALRNLHNFSEWKTLVTFMRKLNRCKHAEYMLMSARALPSAENISVMC